VTNRAALERTLQLGVSEEIAKLERNMSWLATTASVTPFIGLFARCWALSARFTNWDRWIDQPAHGGAGHLGSADCHGGGSGCRYPAAIFYNILATGSGKSARAWTTFPWSS